MAGVLELRAAWSARPRGRGGCRGPSGRSRASPAAAVPGQLLGETALRQSLDGPFQEAARRRLEPVGSRGPNARLTRSLGGLPSRHFPSVIFDGRTRVRARSPPGRPLTCSESNRECMARFRFPAPLQRRQRARVTMRSKRRRNGLEDRGPQPARLAEGAPAAATAEAPHRAGLLRARDPRPHLLDLRDHDGRRQRPPAARGPGAVRRTRRTRSSTTSTGTRSRPSPTTRAASSSPPWTSPR